MGREAELEDLGDISGGLPPDLSSSLGIGKRGSPQDKRARTPPPNSPGILYNYFKSKEDILEEMEARFQERMQRNFEDIRQKDSAREMLTELFNRRIKVHSHRGEKKQSRGRGGLLAEALRSERIRQVFDKRYKQIEKNFGEIIEIGIKNGEISPHVDPKAMAGMLHALFWGLRMQAVIVDQKDIESYRENLVKILLGNTWLDVKKKKK